MQEIKIAVIGGGSTYTPELIEGLLGGDSPVREIVLQDIDARKLEIVGGLAQRMAAAAGGTLRVVPTLELARALDGADFVITQLRVGGLTARIQDERIPLQYGLPGQETTGPGGFAKALRTIPVLLDIAQAMATRCPRAWLINFTNPSGLITEALRLHGHERSVGLCNYPLTLKMRVAQAFGVGESAIELAYFGLNHLSWTRILVDGHDRTEELIEIMISDPAQRELSGYAFDAQRLRGLGLIPSGYLRYYYDTAKMVEEQCSAPQTRGERVREVEKRLLMKYADMNLREKPPELQERGGAWYSTAAVRLVRDLRRSDGGVHILNVPNRGALPFLPDDVIVETPARVDVEGMASLPTVTRAGERFRVAGVPIPEEVITLIQRVKDYELQTVAAAVSGSREQAIAALRAHPLLDGHDTVIPALLGNLLEAHRPLLPHFFPPA
ncbi:MAG: 6-phospho-beta-glucosidase [Armatimonadota bacterium]